MINDPIDQSRALRDSPASLFVRIGVVMRLTGLGRSTIYRLMAEQQFPCPVRLTKRAVGWRRSDLEQWCEGRPLATR